MDRRGFHYDPYSAPLLNADEEDRKKNAASNFFKAAAYAEESAQQELLFSKSADGAASVDMMTCTEFEGGLSENSTDECNPTSTASTATAGNRVAGASTTTSSSTATSPSVIRYASVDFRFGSAWFIAPFRTSVGEIVVVQYPHNGSLHVGLVSCITTVTPPTFTALHAAASAGVTPTKEELLQYPRLLRHARDYDRQTKLEMRSYDLASLRCAQELAEEMHAPVTFIDAEWLLDLTAVTFFVQVWGDMQLVDRLADELAAREGAEVVFTFPAMRYE
ncbi:hypothetical protein TRVL_07675 [Trypanosoma vivax]|nr:hypothetical protein TRVL_07675 [Trypanosoma vivax]